jgi:hypothetical protein
VAAARLHASWQHDEHEEPPPAIILIILLPQTHCAGAGADGAVTWENGRALKLLWACICGCARRPYFSLAAKFLGRLASFVSVAVVAWAWTKRREGVMSVVEDSGDDSSWLQAKQANTIQPWWGKMGGDDYWGKRRARYGRADGVFFISSRLTAVPVDLR